MCKVTNNAVLLGVGFAIAVLCSASAHAQALVTPEDGPPQPPTRLIDHPVAGYQLELMDLAWRAATSYPLNPHIKNRARAEEQVVKGLLELGRAQQAWDKARQVVNWRRGACKAEIAHYLLGRGETEHVDYFLHQALRYAKDSKQGWRQDRVKARVAEARVMMGQDERADQLIAEEDLAGQADRLNAQASLAGEDDYAQMLAVCEQLVATEGYEAVLGALSVYASLYERYYPDQSRRAELASKIRGTWEPIPAVRRFELLLRLAEAALANDDAQHAGALVDEAEELRESYAWPVDFDMGLRSDIARWRIKLDQADRARQMLDDALPVFEKRQAEIENFYRAGALRPVAEGYALLGDQATAHAIYRQVVKLGAVNPNMRPRVSDITATCVSMALHGIEPNAELLAEIRAIVSGLND